MGIKVLHNTTSKYYNVQDMLFSHCTYISVHQNKNLNSMYWDRLQAWQRRPRQHSIAVKCLRTDARMNYKKEKLQATTKFAQLIVFIVYNLRPRARSERSILVVNPPSCWITLRVCSLLHNAPKASAFKFWRVYNAAPIMELIQVQNACACNSAMVTFKRCPWNFFCSLQMAPETAVRPSGCRARPDRLCSPSLYSSSTRMVPWQHATTSSVRGVSHGNAVKNNYLFAHKTYNKQ